MLSSGAHYFRGLLYFQ